MRHRAALIAAFGLSGMMLAGSASADVIYDNLTTNNMIGVATRPSTSGSFEIEAGDDFVASTPVSITSASFIGLVVQGSSAPTVQDVTLEIYRIFPDDSDVGRTSGPPTFSTSQVPTRVNSPADVAFETRDSAAVGELTFKMTVLDPTFTSPNSIQPGGIHLTTGGNGPITGQEVEFDVTLTTPFDLPADHYFFVPQVGLSNGAEFYWLSAPRPVTFPPGFTDLQAWTRDAMLDPDWLRVGTDIVGGTTFNTAFSLNGNAVPEPASTVVIIIGLGYIGYRRWRLVRSGRFPRV